MFLLKNCQKRSEKANDTFHMSSLNMLKRMNISDF